MREQIKILKHQANAQTNAAACRFIRIDRLPIRPIFDQRLPTQGDGAGIDRLQLGDTAQEGTLSGTGGSDDNQLLAFFYFQIYIFQYLEISEILTYIFQSDHFAPPFYVPGRNF